MDINYKETEIRKYLVRDRKTGEESIVRVSNRNNLSAEDQMELLNANDEEKEYIFFIGTVEGETD
ncbi:MAG: hypothetical protein K6B28_13195 [Lachnospiraceae bacterium]|nr:hypothetical protein [Lachnospiraceae bacterium]